MHLQFAEIHDEDEKLGHGYQLSISTDAHDKTGFATSNYLVQRLRNGVASPNNKQRKFGLSISGIPIKLIEPSSDAELHHCSVKEEWFIDGNQIFAHPYRRRLTMKISFKSGEYFSFYDDPLLIITSDVQPQTIMCRYSDFHVHDPGEFCPQLKSGPFSKFPKYIKEISKELLAILTQTRGDTLDAINMITRLAKQEKSEVARLHLQHLSPAASYTGIEELRRLQIYAEPSNIKTWSLF